MTHFNLITYKAASLADIAKSFEARGFDCEKRAGHSTGRVSQAWRTEARVWFEAARILEQTVIE